MYYSTYLFYRIYLANSYVVSIRQRVKFEWMTPLDRSMLAPTQLNQPTQER